MAKKYKECLDCGTQDKKETWSLCSVCRKKRRIKRLELANANKHKTIGKEIPCRNCGSLFKTKGPASLYCEVCGPNIRKEKDKQLYDKYNKAKGVKVGIGSGNYYGRFNKNHPSYKTGVSWYRDLVLRNKPHFCERCSCEIDFSNSYKWCVHHKNHDRTNNNLDNLELLCKRCHQLEHNCTDNLPNN